MIDTIAYAATVLSAPASRIKFNREWSLDGSPLDLGTRRAVLSTEALVRKFNGKGVAPTDIYCRPGEPEPDLDELNGDPSTRAPGLDGEPEPPFKKYADVIFADPQTGATAIWSTGSVTGLRSVGLLAKEMDWCRKFRNSDDIAIVELRTRNVPTKYGTTIAPALPVVDWINKQSSETKALPQPSPIPQPTVNSADKGLARAQRALRKQVSSDLDDEVPF
jgi:hypothetical protein